MSQVEDFILSARGVCILILAHAHLTSRVPPEVLGASQGPVLVNHIGKIGIFIGFVIVGYYAYRHLLNAVNVSQFLSRSLACIWPLFIAASIFIYCFGLIVPAPVVPDGPLRFNTEVIRLIDVVGTVFFLKDFGFRLVDGGFWPIIIVVKIYLLLAIFAFVFKRNFLIFFVVGTFFLAAVDLSMIVFDRQESLSLTNLKTLRVYSKLLHGIFASTYLPFFAIGVLIASRRHQGWLIPLACLGLIVTLVAIVEDDRFETVAAARFVLSLGILLGFDQILGGGRGLRWLGRHWIEIFLVHQMVGLGIMAKVVPLVGFDLGSVVAFVLVVAIAVVLALLFGRRFELPLQRVLERWFERACLNRLRFVPVDRSSSRIET